MADAPTRPAGIPLGHWRGIPVTAHWTVLIAVALFTGLLATSALPGAVKGEATASYWIAALLTAAVFFFTLVAHELAHAAAARHYGMSVRRVTLWVLGGLTELEGEAPSPRAEAVVAGAGPATSLVLGGAFVAASRWLVNGGLPDAALAWLGTVNIVLAVFNALPASPLDGGRLLRAALWWRLGDRTRATVGAARAGQGLGVFLMVFGLLQAMAGAAAGIWLALVGWFLFGAAQSEVLGASTSKLAGLRARDVMTPATTLAYQWWTVGRFLAELTPDRLAQQVYPVVDWDGHPAGAITVRDLERVPARARDETYLRDVAARHRPAPLVVDADTACERFVPLLRLHGGIAVVTEEARPVGVITDVQLARTARLAELGWSRPARRTVPAAQPADANTSSSAPAA